LKDFRDSRKQFNLLLFLIFLLLLVNYPFLDNFLKKNFDNPSEIVVERVIDGDTLAFKKTSIRLLGINTPEKGEGYYLEAKKYLELLSQNKTLRLEYGKKRYDKYGRILAHLFLNGENLNLKLVENGFAVPYFPDGKSKYSLEFKEAWKKCLKNNKALCEKSEEKCASCIIVSEEKDNFEIKNLCGIPCNLSKWTLSGTGRKKISLDEVIFNEIIIEKEKLSLLPSEEILFLRDSENRLVFLEYL
jgi:hypothetical protein